MPAVGTLAIGRDTEIAWLDAALQSRDVGVAGLIAPGGVGKTTVAWNWWLRLKARFPNFRLERFSFYNQGATVASQGSAEVFFSCAFSEWFKTQRPASSWAQGKLLAELVRNERVILILDGLEPLQHALDPHFGYFADERMVAFLQELCSTGIEGLCVCTSRLPLNNLKNYIGHGYHPADLNNLSAHHGAELFKKLGIAGTDGDLRVASESFGNHALSLTLVGRYIAEYHADRDVHRIDTIPPLSSIPVEDERRHALRILSHYESIFPVQTPERALLRCIGLFDRPVVAESLDELMRAPPIAGLTHSLASLSEVERTSALRRLKRLGLIEYERIRDPLDCHPIIRSHFAESLRKDETAWREANRRLFRYYASSATHERPTTLEGMEPLYPATVHACRANDYAEAWSVYWNRIQQGHPTYFNTNVLGAFHAGLGALASFYDPPWKQVAPTAIEALSRVDYLRLLTEVGFHLKVLGRFEEARNVIRSAMESYVIDGNYEDAAVNSESLAETQLLEGHLKEALVALQLGHGGVQFAELSAKPFRRMQTLALTGQIFHYMGLHTEAEAALVEAEEIRMQHCSDRRPVRSLYLLDLLGEIGRYDEMLELSERFRPLLDVRTSKPFTGAFYLFVGQGMALHAMQSNDQTSIEKALQYLDDARQLIDESMLPHLQPRAPCIRARLLTSLGRFEQAKADLHWALAISEHARLKIFQIDCRVGLCHLYQNIGDYSVARTHLEAAKNMIEKSSYQRHRRWVSDMDGKF
jgi:tetratricopeptide (TPR) repeat protein